MAKPTVPFTLNGLLPAHVMIVLGFILLQDFVIWNCNTKTAADTAPCKGGDGLAVRKNRSDRYVCRRAAGDIPGTKATGYSPGNIPF